jgi:succinate-semialdehyde dehydrogenase/glutarate-semialdehyde dehydrogenase
MLIDGARVEADSGRTFEVRDPATGEVVGTVPEAGRAETRRAIEAAARAFPAWAELPAARRADVLVAARDAMTERNEELARLLTAEAGKPIAEARAEIAYAAEFLRFFADEGRRAGGEVIPPHVEGKRLLAIKQPVGVAGILTVWNFPAAGVTRPAGAALAAGCTVVLKPPEQAPLCALAIAEILDDAGLPPGVANFVTTEHPAEVGRELVENALVPKLSFTGSLEVGRQLLRGAAEQVKRVTLELGGNAPFVVFADADVEAAARGAVASKFRNTGQTCVAVNRIYVEEPVLELFARRFAELVAELELGDPRREEVAVGPLIDEDAGRRLQRHVDEALAGGAELLHGGRRRTDGRLAAGAFYEPTVLARVAPGAAVMREETFGPVAPIASFDTESEALERANDPVAGLAAFVYTRDLSRAVRMAERLEFGIVGVNDPLPGAPHVPFGGIKQSGIGKEGGRLGLEEYLETKLVSVAV